MASGKFPEVVNQVRLGHPDATVNDGNRLRIGIVFDFDLEVLEVAEENESSSTLWNCALSEASDPRAATPVGRCTTS